MGERGKINRLEHTDGRSQNKGTEKLQRRAGPSPLEVGGRGEGKGANSAPEKPAPPTPQTGPGSYLRTSWDPTAARPGAAEGKGAPLLGRVRPSLWLPEPLATVGKGAPRQGRVRPSPWMPGPLRPGKAQNAGATESVLLWSTRKLERHSTQGPLHVEQPGAWAVWTGEAQTPLYGANPVWPEHGECSPHTAMISVCSAPPSPQQDWTELANLNKRSPPPACVRAEIRHREGGKQKPNKQRESLQKGPVQQIKIPEGNTNYTGRGL